MIVHAGWFLLGVVFGIVAVIVISCCVVAGDIDREEEKHKTLDGN